MLTGQYRAVVSDVDGVIIRNVSDALPSERVRSTIRQTIERDIPFSLVTGRPYALVKPLLSHLGIKSPSIVDDGAAIIESPTGAVLWEATLPHDQANEILGIVRSFKLVRVSCDKDIFENPKAIPSSHTVRKLSIHNILMTKADKLIDSVTHNFKDITAIKAASQLDPDLIDVYIKNILATKQVSVFELSKYLKIPLKYFMGVGDGYNDLPLLMACGLRVAVENAVPGLKDIAHIVVPSLEQDGLAIALERFILTENLREGNDGARRK